MCVCCGDFDVLFRKDMVFYHLEKTFVKVDSFLILENSFLLNLRLLCFLFSLIVQKILFT